MKRKFASIVKYVAILMGLGLLAAPSLGIGAVTITQVRVVVGGQEYCDSSVAGCSNIIWSLGGGVTLNAGQTLILTQTGPMGSPVVGGNFDTSDRGESLSTCTTNPPGSPCTVQIYINSGSGLTQVYSNIAGDPLDAFNAEPTQGPSSSFNEAAPWQLAFMGSTYRLDIGYADNEHSNACPASGCFPQPVWGPAGATVFLGQGLPAGFGGFCGDANHPLAADGGCYDAGALLITALATSTPQGCTPGYWKNHATKWPATYSPSQLVSSVFTVPAQLSGFGSLTLLQALSLQGGPGVDGATQILLRAAVSALLNSASVSYPLTTAQVIAQVNAALASLNRNTILTLATTLDDDNNLGCPLN